MVVSCESPQLGNQGQNLILIRGPIKEEHDRLRAGPPLLRTSSAMERKRGRLTRRYLEGPGHRGTPLVFRSSYDQPCARARRTRGTSNPIFRAVGLAHGQLNRPQTCHHFTRLLKQAGSATAKRPNHPRIGSNSVVTDLTSSYMSIKAFTYLARAMPYHMSLSASSRQPTNSQPPVTPSLTQTPSKLVPIFIPRGIRQPHWNIPTQVPRTSKQWKIMLQVHTVPHARPKPGHIVPAVGFLPQ